MPDDHFTDLEIEHGANSFISQVREKMPGWHCLGCPNVYRSKKELRAHIMRHSHYYNLKKHKYDYLQVKLRIDGRSTCNHCQCKKWCPLGCRHPCCKARSFDDYDEAERVTVMRLWWNRAFLIEVF